MARLPIEHMKRPEAPITVVDVDEARRLLGCVRGARIHRAVTTRASACSSTPACGWLSSRTSRWMTSTRCLRMPRRHPRARESALRLGERGHGPMTDNGVAQVLRRRVARSWWDNLHAHQFRHTFAALTAQRGRQRRQPHAPGRLAESPVARPLRRQRCDERALEAHRRMAPDDGGNFARGSNRALTSC